MHTCVCVCMCVLCVQRHKVYTRTHIYVYMYMRPSSRALDLACTTRARTSARSSALPAFGSGYKVDTLCAPVVSCRPLGDRTWGTLVMWGRSCIPAPLVCRGLGHMSFIALKFVPCSLLSSLFGSLGTSPSLCPVLRDTTHTYVCATDTGVSVGTIYPAPPPSPPSSPPW